MNTSKKIIGFGTVVAICLFVTSAFAALHPDTKIRYALQDLFAKAPQVGGFPYQQEMEEAARRYNLPLPYVLAVARGESFFDPKAKSSKGAIGIMQVMPSTAADYGTSEADLFDPTTNIDVGVHLLADLYDRLKDPYLTLAAYYCGCGGVDMSEETVRKDCDEYVRYIHSHLQKVLAQAESPERTEGIIETQAGESKHFILNRFDNFLDAENFITFLHAKLPEKQFDVFRAEVPQADHIRYQYQVMAEYSENKEKEATCRNVTKATGFMFCE